MKNLIIPMAGKSSRFPNMRPKWMLTHPKQNKFMVIESISGLNLDFFDNIYFVVLQEHEDKYKFSNGLLKEVEELGVLDKVKISYLDEQTSSQSETVYKVIRKENIEGFVFIKDSDNYYECEIKDTSNQVVYVDLNENEGINAKGKSYIELDDNKVLTNIVEKKIVSSTFCCGGYGFSSSEQFCSTYESLQDIEEECYISHIIFEMMLSGFLFQSTPAFVYKDWGTLVEWKKYKKTYKTIFCDIDGTLVTNTSHQFPPFIGEGDPIESNINYLNKLFDEGRTHIVLTTSRPEEYRQITLDELESKGIPYHNLIMGLPHSQRVLVNDFAASNPYPSCVAINIPRNSEDLETYF
mgnify:FL=1|jgi:hydroxymethylpyrimidine pyrophosphatase-like HAD family hydrolase|tara:strand:- start:855 stop:1910 length:1056 start_codon:yes stop_codon:yes gene_type:complete